MHIENCVTPGEFETQFRVKLINNLPESSPALYNELDDPVLYTKCMDDQSNRSIRMSDVGSNRSIRSTQMNNEGAKSKSLFAKNVEVLEKSRLDMGEEAEKSPLKPTIGTESNRSIALSRNKGSRRAIVANEDVDGSPSNFKRPGSVHMINAKGENIASTSGYKKALNKKKTVLIDGVGCANKKSHMHLNYLKRTHRLAIPENSKNYHILSNFVKLDFLVKFDRRKQKEINTSKIGLYTINLEEIIEKDM